MYAGELTSRLSLFKNVYRIYLFIVWFAFTPSLMNWQKGGEIFCEFIYAYFSHLLVFIQKGGEGFWVLIYTCFCIYMFWFLTKRGRSIWCVYACLSPYLCIHVCLVLCPSLNILLFIVMHELRGSFYKAWLLSMHIYLHEFCHHQKGGDCWPRGLPL